MKRLVLGLGMASLGAVVIVWSWLGDVLAALDDGDVWT